MPALGVYEVDAMEVEEVFKAALEQVGGGERLGGLVSGPGEDGGIWSCVHWCSHAF